MICPRKSTQPNSFGLVLDFMLRVTTYIAVVHYKKLYLLVTKDTQENAALLLLWRFLSLELRSDTEVVILTTHKGVQSQGVYHGQRSDSLS